MNSEWISKERKVDIYNMKYKFGSFKHALFGDPLKRKGIEFIELFRSRLWKSITQKNILFHIITF